MIRFKSLVQFLMFLAFSVFAVVAFIGGFFNPAQFILSAMSAIMCITIYKCW